MADTVYDILYEELQKIETNIGIESYNDNNDNMCSIHLYQLSDQTLTFDTSIIRRLGLQIRVRDVNFVNGYNRALAILNIFKKYIDSTKKITTTSKSDIITLPRDEHNRNIYTINFNLTIIE